MERYKNAFSNIKIPSDMPARILGQLNCHEDGHNEEKRIISYENENAKRHTVGSETTKRIFRTSIPAAACILVLLVSAKAGMLTLHNDVSLTLGDSDQDTEVDYPLTMPPASEGNLQDADTEQQISDSDTDSNKTLTDSNRTLDEDSNADKKTEKQLDDTDEIQSDNAFGNMSGAVDESLVHDENAWGSNGTSGKDATDTGSLFNEGNGIRVDGASQYESAESFQAAVGFKLKMPLYIPEKYTQVCYSYIFGIAQIRYASQNAGDADNVGGADNAGDAGDVDHTSGLDNADEAGDADNAGSADNAGGAGIAGDLYNTEDSMLFRMAEGKTDISGDYNDYKIKYVRDGYEIRGNEDVALVIWNDGSFSYSLSFDSEICVDEALRIARSVA